MKRKVKGLSILLIGILSLFGCEAKTELSEYVDVHFEGYDTIGRANYSVNTEELIGDIFDITE